MNIKSSILWNQWRLGVINQVRTRLITEDSFVTLVTHSLRNSWSDHKYLLVWEWEWQRSFRFIPFAMICWSSPSNRNSSNRFTSLRGAAVAAACKWTEAKKKLREREELALHVNTRLEGRSVRGMQSGPLAHDNLSRCISAEGPSHASGF
jgi:hypothetical protein